MSLRVSHMSLSTLALVLMVSLATIPARATHFSSHFWEIVPGVGLLERPSGQAVAVIGMDRDAVERGLASTDCDPSWFTPEYDGKWILRSLAIGCGGAARTAKGSQVGSLGHRVRAEFGDPLHVYGDPAPSAWLWVYRGIEFRMVRDASGWEAVQAIRVMPK